MNNYGVHTTHLPYTAKIRKKQYTFYILTRHPYKRILSLYGAWLAQLPAPISFELFIKNYVFSFRFPYFTASISYWITDFTRNNPGAEWIELPLDKSVDMLAKHNINFELPHLNQTKHPSLEEAYTTELIQLVNYWAYWDFKWLEYEPKPWW